MQRSSAVLLLEEENRTFGSRGNTQRTGIKPAVQASRETVVKETAKQLVTTARLNMEVTAKEKEITDLKAKLNQTDIDHQNHLEATLKEQSESHQAVLEAQEASFYDCARQWEEERETFDCKLKGVQEKLDLEKGKHDRAVQRSIDADRDKNKVQTALEEKTSTHYQIVTAHVTQLKELEITNQELNNEVASFKAEFERREATNLELNQQIKKLQEDVERLSKELETELLAQQPALNKLRSEIQTQVKEQERQKFEVELKEKTDELHQKWEKKIKSLIHEHQHQLTQCAENIQKKINVEVQAQFEKKYTQATKEAERQSVEKLTKLCNDHRTAMTESIHKHQEEMATQRELARNIEVKYLAKLKEQKQEYAAAASMEHVPEMSRDNETLKQANVKPETEHKAMPQTEGATVSFNKLLYVYMHAGTYYIYPLC